MIVKEVLEFIVNVTQNATKCEENKQILNDHFAFEPYALFSRIDRDDKKYLTKDDFIWFLNDCGVGLDNNRNTVDLFIEYYDRDFDDKLNFTEFLNFVLSKDHDLIRSIATQRETYKLSNNEFLESKFEDLTANLLLSEFYLFEYANVKKMEIFNSAKEKIDLLSLFIEMDCDKDGFISNEDLEKTLSKRKIKICLDEIMSFIALFDEDIDGMLNWNEFLFMILPSPTNYDYDLTELKMLESKYEEYYSNRKNDIQTNNSLINSQSYVNQSAMQSKDFLSQSKTYPFNNSILNSDITKETGNFSEIAGILYKVIDYEKQIELLREKLFYNGNFNLDELFNYFDKYGNDYVSFMDFNDALESLDIVNKNSILVFSRYDVDNLGRLSKMNFSRIFLPMRKELNSENNITITNANLREMSQDIKITIVQLLETLMNYHNYFSTLSKWYESNKNEIDYCFNKIDKDRKGFLNIDDFGLIFDRKISEQDLLLIMEIIDSDKDGKITYEDMVNFFK